MASFPLISSVDFDILFLFGTDRWARPIGGIFLFTKIKLVKYFNFMDNLAFSAFLLSKCTNCSSVMVIWPLSLALI